MLLLAGEDTWLKVYDVETCRLLGQLRVFSSQPIHGIHIPESGMTGADDEPPDRMRSVAAIENRRKLMLEQIIRSGSAQVEELASRFGVSRMTARNAMQKLAEDGLISRKPGRGSFVADPPAHRRANRLMTFSQEMRRAGRVPSSRVLTRVVRPATEPEADAAVNRPEFDRQFRAGLVDRIVGHLARIPARIAQDVQRPGAAASPLLVIQDPQAPPTSPKTVRPLGRCAVDGAARQPEECRPEPPGMKAEHPRTPGTRTPFLKIWRRR